MVRFLAAPCRVQRDKIPSASGIDVAGTVVLFRAVKLLCVTLDSALTMDRHVTEVTRSCNYHIRALRHIRPLLTLDVANTIGHSIVTSLLDYANALLRGTSKLVLTDPRGKKPSSGTTAVGYSYEWLTYCYINKYYLISVSKAFLTVNSCTVGLFRVLELLEQLELRKSPSSIFLSSSCSKYAMFNNI